MRQAEGALLQTILIGSATGGIPSFEDKDACFFFQGRNASVEMNKADGRLRVFQKGQVNPFYDSEDLESCVDLDHSWCLSHEVSNEIQRAICQSMRNARKPSVVLD
ncbi:hypothetical protein [Pseudomonas putida]|uniref:Uncharacterized protein n=1 Tax=Pseudomonas putida TaxID=303 RepID=A0A8I1ED19_PSEPU|nr:hypothetical protein [Pseudomonas putida]MBI6883033.1 hypothetical protein [Pseudomonas putida]